MNYETDYRVGNYGGWEDRDDDIDTECGEHRAMREAAEREADLEWRMEEDRRKREESEAREMRDPSAVGRFLYAGNATFTLRSKKTGTRFTYRVSHKKGGDVSFVSLLTGPDNTSDYRYMGLLPDDKAGEIRGVGRGKSCADYDAPSAKAFRYFLDFVWGRNEGKGLEIWHEGRCGRCGRKLTVPESIETGLGPECAGKV